MKSCLYCGTNHADEWFDVDEYVACERCYKLTYLSTHYECDNCERLFSIKQLKDTDFGLLCSDCMEEMNDE